MWYRKYSILSATIIAKPFHCVHVYVCISFIISQGTIWLNWRRNVLFAFSRTENHVSKKYNVFSVCVCVCMYVSQSRRENTHRERQFYASVWNARSTNAKRRVIGNKYGGCLTPFHYMCFMYHRTETIIMLKPPSALTVNASERSIIHITLMVIFFLLFFEICRNISFQE